jgi:hypothetical protein
VKEIQRNVNGDREGSEVGLRSPVIVSARSEAPTSVALSTKGASARRISMRLRRLTGGVNGWRCRPEGGRAPRTAGELCFGPRNWSGSAERRILGAIDDWLVGGSSRMLLRLSGHGRLVAGV